MTQDPEEEQREDPTTGEILKDFRNYAQEFRDYVQKKYSVMDLAMLAAHCRAPDESFDPYPRVARAISLMYECWLLLKAKYDRDRTPESGISGPERKA